VETGGTEMCDDGDTVDGDGCSSSCSVECGFTCTSAQPSVCESSCDDGVKASSEACDDGNSVDGDGCSSTCSIEPGWNENGIMDLTLKLSSRSRVNQCNLLTLDLRRRVSADTSLRAIATKDTPATGPAMTARPNTCDKWQWQ